MTERESSHGIEEAWGNVRSQTMEGSYDTSSKLNGY
jgi:hypothetical protein